MGYTLFVAFVLVLGIVTVFKAVRVVPQGFEWTVERFGKYTHTMNPGLHFLMPWMQRVGRKVNMMEQVLEVDSQDVITKASPAAWARPACAGPRRCWSTS